MGATRLPGVVLRLRHPGDCHQIRTSSPRVFHPGFWPGTGYSLSLRHRQCPTHPPRATAVSSPNPPNPRPGVCRAQPASLRGLGNVTTARRRGHSLGCYAPPRTCPGRPGCAAPQGGPEGPESGFPRRPRCWKDMVTPVTQCLAPRALMTCAVPACGHLPPSSCSWPTVTSTLLSTLAARTGAMQHRLKGEERRISSGM